MNNAVGLNFDSQSKIQNLTLGFLIYNSPMKYRALFAASLLLSAWGCAALDARHVFPPDVIAYDLAPEAKNYPPTDPNQIILYPEPKFAPKAYVLLARLKSSPMNDCRSEEELFGLFKKRAAQVGADVVVVLQVLRPLGTKPPHILTGSQPINDLGYVDHSTNTTGLTVVEGEPTPGTKKLDWYTGYALAIHSKPR